MLRKCSILKGCRLPETDELPVGEDLSAGKGVSGGYTVEAAILMPIAFALVLFFLSVSLQQYGKICLDCWVYGTAQEMAYQKNMSKEDAGVIGEKAGKQTGTEGLFVEIEKEIS